MGKLVCFPLSGFNGPNMGPALPRPSLLLLLLKVKVRRLAAQVCNPNTQG